MISGGNATLHVSDLDDAIEFYTRRVGLTLTNRFGTQWATVQTGPSYWTTDEVGGRLTIGLRPASPASPAAGLAGGIGFGFETYDPIERVIARLTERGVRVDEEIVRYDAGNCVSFVDGDGTPTYLNEFPPDMVPEPDRAASAVGATGDAVSGGHAIVYVSDMDVAIRFYTETLGLALTHRFEDKFATVEAGLLVIAIHPRTPGTPVPGARGSVVLGLTVDEPIERVVSRLAARGVRVAGAPSREPRNAIDIEDPDGNPIHLSEGDPAGGAPAHGREAAAATK